MQQHQFRFVSRRQMLNRSAVGFGGLALKGLLSGECLADSDLSHPRAPRLPHFVPRAKLVIFLFMLGGPSHIDLFDPKPRLDRDDGKPLPLKRARLQNAKRGNLMRSPWSFKRYGDSGIPMSRLWRHLPDVADELCMIRSMWCDNNNHPQGTRSMLTGKIFLGRPTLGAWVSYGLGSEKTKM